MIHIDPNSPREKSIDSLHILWEPEPALFGPITQCVPRAIKLVADDQDLLYLANMVEANPRILDETILIARPFKLTETAMAMVNAATLPTDVMAAASWLHQSILKLRRDYPRLAELPIYWEGLNEPNRSMMDRIVSFDVASALQAERDGIRRLLGGFSEGTPDIIDYPAPERPTNDDWPVYYPALQAIHDVGPDVAMLHVHEYAVGVGGIPDKSAERNELLRQPWRVGRINKVYERHIRPKGWLIATVVSEGPLDKPNLGINDELKVAWMTDPEFEELYCDEVEAVTLYTMDANQEWDRQGFNMRSIGKKICDHITTYKPDGIIEIPPVPEPEPEPVPDSTVAIRTTHPVGQWIRKYPSLDSVTVGALDHGEIGYVSQEEAISIGQDCSWVHVQAGYAEGWCAAWLLERNE